MDQVGAKSAEVCPPISPAHIVRILGQLGHVFLSSIDPLQFSSISPPPLSDRVFSQPPLGQLFVRASAYICPSQVQDWGGPVGDPTGGKRDGTWGTWSTDYALGVQCLVYGMTAPGGTGATSARVGFLVEGLGWAGAGIMHQFFYQPSSTHDVLWMTSLVLGVFAGPLKAGGVAVMAAAKDDSSSKRRAATIGCCGVLVRGNLCGSSSRAVGKSGPNSDRGGPRVSCPGARAASQSAWGFGDVGREPAR